MPLSDENRRDARPPDFFDGGKDAQFVVHQHVVLGGKAPLDVVQFHFFVNVNEHVAVDGLE